MEKQQLRDLLQRLHTQLDQTDSVDEESRRLLRELVGDIHEVLDESESAGKESLSPFRERLDDAVRRFEVRHPTITAAVKQLIDVLPK